MNFLNRAFKNVTRRPTKSVLLGITFLLIGNLVILGLGISQAAENAKTLTKQKMRAVVSYEVDYEAYWIYTESLTDQDEIDEAYKNYPKIDKDTALKISQDKDVETFNYLTNYVMFSQNFTHVPLGNEELKGGYSSTYVDEEGNEHEYKEPNIFVFTNIIPNMIEFEEGANTIVEGRFYSQDEIDNNANVAVISQELANINNLQVGDEIILSNDDISNGGYYSQFEITQEDMNDSYEVIGIYSTVNDVDPNSENFKWMSPYESPKNFIYIPLTTMANNMYEKHSKLFEFEKEMYPDMDYEGPKLDDYLSPHKVVILLNDPLNVDAFIERNEGNLAAYTMLNANNESFKTMAKPLDTLSFFANVIVWIVGVNAIVIISLVTALTLKTREYEIGVLLSLGVSKVKVVLQLFMELVIVALIGFTLAVVTGSMIAGQVGDKVLEFQQSQQEESQDDYWMSTSWHDPTDYFTTITEDDLFNEYRVSVNPILIAEIYVFGLGVVFIAILVPSVMIMRLNPKQILLSTN